MVHVFPTWYHDWLNVKVAAERANTSALAPQFPLIMPFIIMGFNVTQSGAKSPSGEIVKTDANTMAAHKQTVLDIVAFAERAAGNDDAYQKLVERDDVDEKDMMALQTFFDEHVHFVNRDLALANVMKRCLFNLGDVDPVIPCLPYLKMTAVCHEMGVVAWDAASATALRLYYRTSNVRQQLVAMKRDAALALHAWQPIYMMVKRILDYVRAAAAAPPNSKAAPPSLKPAAKRRAEDGGGKAKAKAKKGIAQSAVVSGKMVAAKKK